MPVEITRAITVRQPYAALIACEAKRYETRGYQPRCVAVGDRLAIHAGSTVQQGIPAEVAHRIGITLTCVDEPLGAIVATARLGAVISTDAPTVPWVGSRELERGDWSPGRYAWRLDDVHRLAEPIPCRGALGLWALPADVREQLEAGR